MYRNWHQIDFGETTLPYTVDKEMLERFGRSDDAESDGPGAKATRAAGSVWAPLGIRR